MHSSTKCNDHTVSSPKIITSVSDERRLLPFVRLGVRTTCALTATIR